MRRAKAVETVKGESGKVDSRKKNLTTKDSGSDDEDGGWGLCNSGVGLRFCVAMLFLHH